MVIITFGLRKDGNTERKDGKPATQFKVIKLKGELDKDINEDKYFNF